MSSSESTTNQRTLEDNLKKVHLRTRLREKQKRYRAQKKVSQTHKTLVQPSKKKRTESPVVATCSTIPNISIENLSMEHVFNEKYLNLNIYF